MRTISLDKTLTKCRAHWEAAQRNPLRKFTVFSPIFLGEKYIGAIDEDKWPSDVILSFSGEGADGLVRNLNYNECNTRELFERLGKEEFKEFSAQEIINFLTKGYGELKMNSEEKEIALKWMNENIDAELDFWWSQENDEESPENIAKEAILEYAKRNNCGVE